MLSSDRILIAKLALEINRSLREGYFPNEKDAHELVLIRSVLVAANKPLTVSAIARQTSLSRTTALRRLDKLCAVNLAVKENGYYREGGRELPAKLQMRMIAAINETCSKLSKLNK